MVLHALLYTAINPECFRIVVVIHLHNGGTFPAATGFHTEIIIVVGCQVGFAMTAFQCHLLQGDRGRNAVFDLLVYCQLGIFLIKVLL